MTEVVHGFRFPYFAFYLGLYENVFGQRFIMVPGRFFLQYPIIVISFNLMCGIIIF